ncbi:MAG: M48 family metallopeptidase [Deltaproteobacteria bacterium]|nr:M48 family metallopeptidase [Deltaproteobacteria bacterium]
MIAALLAAYLLVLTAEYALKALNLRHLKAVGHLVPEGFEGEVDAATLAKTSAYTFDKSRVALVESAVESAIFLLFLFAGWLGVYDRWIGSLVASPIGGGVLFFVGLTLIQSVLGIPFGAYDTFRIESRHGFNATTPGLWVADLVKGLAVSAALIALVTAGALGLVRWSPGAWWLWVWGFFVGVSVLMLFLSPYVIEPLFFRFQPVQKEGIEEEIRRLMDKAGLTVGRVFQVDASRRSRHSNAYFTGIGRVKRVVLFDTLLDQMSPAEIVAVLAHEVGHWKRRHVIQRLGLTAGLALAGLYLAFRLVGWGGVPGLVGLDAASLPAQAVILWLVAGIAGFFVTPFFSALSRRNEREADRFACELSGDPGALASALIKLSRENLANLHPHPLYAAFYLSHPPVVERVRVLRAARPQTPARSGAGAMIS